MKRILIVDDDVTICKLVASILEEEYEVTYATELDSARRVLTESRFDLIIADYYVGSSHNYQSNWPLGELCRTIAPNTPIIALTGSDPSLQGVMKAGGARAIVSKPFDMYDLLGTVDQTIS